ncbi:MAG: 3-deoxy-manno-octulosonate cytidylyltransferase [Bdellovibrionaceae bacterium]|nr:3-deoxy-manno-octulosonate cytidylyltransferase [Pseudobdellovibrionaceae bacterium]|tara:strand:+ start:2300 stop:3052 length:753 start_codon:yes stop_codon:yes gene_type:complete
MKVVAIIPARYESSRFPGKPLASLCGRPMIQWVVERARQSKKIDQVVVATDDQRIVTAVEQLGEKAVMTPSDLASGTDRVAYVSKSFDADFYINLQGDEPLLNPASIDRAVDFLQKNSFDVVTLMTKLRTQQDLESKDVVKVVYDQNHKAIYFSRYPIGVSRVEYDSAIMNHLPVRQHLGVYLFKKDALKNFSEKTSVLEKGESLEQLRALYCGLTIGMVEVPEKTRGVDTPEDLIRVEKMLKEEQHGNV